MLQTLPKTKVFRSLTLKRLKCNDGVMMQQKLF